MTPWVETALGDVCIKIGSGATPRGGKDSYVEKGVALIRSMNVFDARFHADGLAFITDEQAAQLKSVEVRAGDVLVNITGASVARSCLAPVWVLPARVNQHVAIVRLDPARAAPGFVNAYLVSPEGKGKLLGLAAGGATREALTKATLEKFSIRLPPIRVQRQVADVLDALGSLIENNRRRIDLLAQMAQDIYREWFVRFRYPGHEDVPLVDSSLGPIPRGWQARTWGDLATLDYGRALRGYRDATAGYPVFGTNGPIGWHHVPLFPPGVIVGRKGAYRGIHITDRPCWVIDTAFYLKIRDLTRVPAIYAYHQLRTVDLDSIDSGSAIPSTTRDSFYAIPIVVPPLELVRRFSDSVEVFAAMKRPLDQGSQSLRAIRDLLLPSLVTGQIDVSDLDLDAFVDSVA